MIKFRHATKSDLVFVISSWETSFRRSHTAGLITMDTWPEVMHDQLERILSRPYVTTVVAYEESDPDFIYGYLVTESDEKPPLVYWVYVKSPYRKQGIARQLFRAAGVDVTGPFEYCCSTPVVSRLPIPLAKWNPIKGRYSRDHRKHGS